MATNDLFFYRNLPAKLIRQMAAKMEKRVQAEEESIPWWAYRRLDGDSVAKTMDVQALNILTSTYKRIR